MSRYTRGLRNGMGALRKDVTTGGCNLRENVVGGVKGMQRNLRKGMSNLRKDIED